MNNETIQEKLFNEISIIFNEKIAQTNNVYFYNQLVNNAPYLNAVITEIIRKYSSEFLCIQLFMLTFLFKSRC